jgi:hypothetical protein
MDAVLSSTEPLQDIFSELLQVLEIKWECPRIVGSKRGGLKGGTPPTCFKQLPDGVQAHILSMLETDDFKDNYMTARLFQHLAADTMHQKGTVDYTAKVVDFCLSKQNNINTEIIVNPNVSVQVSKDKGIRLHVYFNLAYKFDERQRTLYNELVNYAEKNPEKKADEDKVADADAYHYQYNRFKRFRKYDFDSSIGKSGGLKLNYMLYNKEINTTKPDFNLKFNYGSRNSLSHFFGIEEDLLFDPLTYSGEHKVFIDTIEQLANSFKDTFVPRIVFRGKNTSTDTKSLLENVSSIIKTIQRTIHPRKEMDTFQYSETRDGRWPTITVDIGAHPLENNTGFEYTDESKIAVLEYRGKTYYKNLPNGIALKQFYQLIKSKMDTIANTTVTTTSTTTPRPPSTPRPPNRYFSSSEATNLITRYLHNPRRVIDEIRRLAQDGPSELEQGIADRHATIIATQAVAAAAMQWGGKATSERVTIGRRQCIVYIVNRKKYIKRNNEYIRLNQVKHLKSS